MIRDNLTNCSALVNALVESIRQEEAILERLIAAANSGETKTVMAAATELATLRKAAKPQNCAA